MNRRPGYEAVLASIDEWNSHMPPGTAVVYVDPSDGKEYPTTTRSLAWGLGDTDKPHVAVVLLAGRTGGYDLRSLRLACAAPEKPTPT